MSPPVGCRTLGTPAVLSSLGAVTVRQPCRLLHGSSPGFGPCQVGCPCVSSLLDEDVLLRRSYLRFSRLALPRPLGPAYCLYWRVTLLVPRPVFFYAGLRGATVPCGLPVTCHGWMPLRVRRASPSLLVIAWLLWTTSRGD